MNAELTINGTAIPSPTSIDFSYADLDDGSGRDVKTQIMHRNRARANVLTLTVSYTINDGAKIAAMLALVTKSTFTLGYYDPLTNARKTGTFYSGDRTGGITVLKNGVYCKTVKFNLIQC